MSISKEELKIRLVELERHYELAHLAVKIGWIPFIVLGLGVTALVVAQIWDDQQNTMDDTGIVMLFACVVGAMIAFYAFVFRRAAKINAEITRTKVALKIDATGRVPEARQ